MITLTHTQLASVVPNLPSTKLSIYLPHIQAGMDKYEISANGLRVAAYLAQLAEESAEFTRFIEGMSYSADRLVAVWPKRFPTIAAARPYARNPEKLANFVYANRMGNGDVASGDGWKHRGYGPIQLTGKEMHAKCGAALKLPLVDRPELLASPEIGFMSSAWFWHEEKNLNPLADAKNFREITVRINGGLTNYAKRVAFYEKTKKALGV